MRSSVGGGLQGIKLADEFVAERFEGRPVLSHVLNQHLQDRAVMKEEFEKKIADLDTALKAQQSS